MTTPEPVAMPTSDGRRALRVLLGLAVIFGLLYVVALLPRLALNRDLAADAEAARARVPVVQTTSPRRAADTLDVPLPGSMEPILTTGIFARTNGYLHARYVDIGDRVTQGQLLADIDTPEVDQQLRSAMATLAQGRANVVKAEADLALARSTMQRYVVAGPGTVSQQTIDERRSAVVDADKTVDAARATVNAFEADVQRLTELQSFQKVYAPFDGVITVRNVDPGSLISAGSSSAVTELFRLAQVNVLRIFVYVPQAYANDIAAGQTATVVVRELPGRTFTGTVTRTAGAIDPASRTMLTEVQVPNPEGALLSGAYATVRFAVRRATPPLVLPSNALLIDAQGVRVARVNPDGTLHYKPVVIGRDYGTEVEVLSGVDAHEILATGLPGGVPDGSRVEVATPKPATP